MIKRVVGRDGLIGFEKYVYGLFVSVHSFFGGHLVTTFAGVGLGWLERILHLFMYREMSARCNGQILHFYHMFNLTTWRYGLSTTVQYDPSLNLMDKEQF